MLKMFKTSSIVGACFILNCYVGPPGDQDNKSEKKRFKKKIKR